MPFPDQPGKDYWVEQYFGGHQCVHQTGAVKLSFTGQRLYYAWHKDHMPGRLEDLAGGLEADGDAFASNQRPLAANIRYGLASVAWALRLWWRPHSQALELHVKDLGLPAWTQDPLRPGSASRSVAELAYAAYLDCASQADLCIEYARKNATHDPKKYSEQTLASELGVRYDYAKQALVDFSKIVNAHKFS